MGVCIDHWGEDCLQFGKEEFIKKIQIFHPFEGHSIHQKFMKGILVI